MWGLCVCHDESVLDRWEYCSFVFCVSVGRQGLLFVELLSWCVGVECGIDG